MGAPQTTVDTDTRYELSARAWTRELLHDLIGKTWEEAILIAATNNKTITKDESNWGPDIAVQMRDGRVSAAQCWCENRDVTVEG